MPTIAISVECQSARSGRCYTKEIVQAAEEFTIPLTWLIFVSEKDPMSNISLYHTEYFHRIPAWHETGLLLKFENSNGYISDPQVRGDLIRIGKDVLKQCHVKPTSFRSYDFDLLPADIKHLEDIGILVDTSACPAASDKHGVTRPDGPRQPYHPGYDDLNVPGDAKLLIAPLATHQGIAGNLDQGWEKIQPLLEHCLANQEVTVLSLSDDVDNAQTLHRVIAYAKERGARFTQLTELVTL